MIACSQPEAPKTNTEKPLPQNLTSEIQKANDNFMMAYNAHDAKKVATEIFAEAAVIYPPGSPPVTGGPEVLEGFWQAVMDSGIDKAEIKTTEATAYGDFAIESGSVKLYSAEGALLDDAKYVVQWKKSGDQWKILKDIWNSNKQ